VETGVEKGAARTAVDVAGQPPAQSRGRWDAGRVGLALAALAVLALAVVFHSYRLAKTPGWDPQEGYNLDFAWNLLHGRLRLFALTRAFAQHPPLFYLQLMLLIRLFGYSMGTLRALAAVYAVVTCAALLGMGRQLIGAGPALWAGFVFTAAPLFLANTRWGYTYSLLMLLGLLCVWTLWRYAETRTRRWLLLAALLAGLGVLSDYEGVALVGLVLLAALRLRRRDAWPAALVALGVPLAGLALSFALAPAVFAADVGDTFGRAAGGSPLLQLIEVLVNYYRFVTLDPWIVLGLVGLLLVGEARRRALLLTALGLLGLVVLKVRELGPSFHTAVPLLPLLALGAGVALDAAVRHLYAWVVGVLSPGPSPLRWGGERGTSNTGDTEEQRREMEGGRRGRPTRARWPTRQALLRRGRNVLAAVAVFGVVISPLAIALASDASGLATALDTPQNSVLAMQPADAQAVAAYVLEHARPGDVALGSPQVIWMLDQPDDRQRRPRPLYAADILQALAAQGQAAAFYPAGLPPQRWAFDVSIGHARYVIVDNLVRQLAAPGEVEGLASLLASVETWPAVYRRGEYTVYERPVATGPGR
jgi:hypothetical protein